MLNVAYNFEKLIEIIENKPCLLRFYQIIQYTCNDQNDQTHERTRSAVKTKRGRSERFETRCGVRQGSGLEIKKEKKNTKILMFVEDVMLWTM